MIKNKQLAIFSLFISTFLVLSTSPKSVQAETQAPPIVVELFSSKYCPACPPADENFSALANNPNVIALSCHVTYFNSRARQDTLSAPFCDARQLTYNDQLGTRGVFTPMTVVNGKTYTTGVDREKLKTLLQTHQPLRGIIGFRKNADVLDIRLPAMSVDQGADIWLVEYRTHQTLKGYTPYRNVITNFTKLLKWNGQPLNMAFPLKEKEGKNYALLVQNENGILGAAKTQENTTSALNQ